MLASLSAHTSGMGSHTILAKLSDWFLGPPRFRVPVDAGSPNFRVRLLRPDDYAICEEIYRLNEVKHFPGGFLEKFVSALKSPRHVFLVAEVDGRVRAVAGFSMPANLSHCITWLAFGMVHPESKGVGLGTTLLLSRLAALPQSHTPCTVVMTSVGGSNTFYERFGFRYFQVPPKFNEYGFDHYRVHLSLGDRIRCEQSLRGIQVAEDEIRAASEAARLASFATAAPSQFA